MKKQELWEKLYAAEERQLSDGIEEKSWTDGEDGEGEFDRRVLEKAKDKNVIDIGCGTGEFSLRIAAIARRVLGVDFSRIALAKALKNKESGARTNVEFKFSLADRLPSPEESFDLAITRRGPALDTDQSTMEAYRVLRKGGEFQAQEIGVRDKQNWIRVFSRGEIYPAVAEFDIDLKNRMSKAGFKDIIVEEFEANEYFGSIDDVILRLENSPIIPNFNRKLDADHLREIEEKFKTLKGIVTNSHRVLIRARK